MDQGASLKNILMTARKAITVSSGIFSHRFHKNNIFPDLTDAFPGIQNSLSLPRKQQNFPAWDDDGRNPSVAGSNSTSTGQPKGFTVAGIDDFFLFSDQ